MDLYLVGVFLVMGFLSVTGKDKEDTWENAFKFLLVSLMSWLAVGTMIALMLKALSGGKE